MSAAIKGLVVAGGAGLVAIGSYFTGVGVGYKPKTIFDLPDNDDYKDKIGRDLQHFLAAPFPAHNESFWKSSFDKFIKGQRGSSKRELSSEFAHNTKVKMAFAAKNGSGADDAKALNRVCDAAYKKSKTDLTGDDSDGNKKKLLSDIFTYCSLPGHPPLTIKEANSTHQDKTLGKEKEDKLIDAEDFRNDAWWSIKDEEFRKIALNDVDSSFQGARIRSAISLKDVCRLKYLVSTENSKDSTSPTLEELVLKYCTILGG